MVEFDELRLTLVNMKSDLEMLGAAIGIVILSQNVESNDALLQKLTEIYVILSVIAVVIAALFMGLWVKKQNAPLKEMAKTARDFGHGDLDARVELRSNYSAEVEELALAFNNMASSLQKSEYQRQEFVANVSHELKTPMTTIGGYIDGILQGGTVLREVQEIPPRERAGEYLMLRLRTASGMEPQEYENRFLLPFAPIERALTELQDRRLATKTFDGRWRLTPEGYLLSNAIISDLLLIQEKTDEAMNKYN